MRVLVKGNPVQVLAAARERGMPVQSEPTGGGRWAECWLLVPDRYRAQVIMWFGSDVGGAPFPPGTCLWYQ